MCLRKDYNQLEISKLDKEEVEKQLNSYQSKIEVDFITNHMLLEKQAVCNEIKFYQLKKYYYEQIFHQTITFIVNHLDTYLDNLASKQTENVMIENLLQQIYHEKPKHHLQNSNIEIIFGEYSDYEKFYENFDFESFYSETILLPKIYKRTLHQSIYISPYFNLKIFNFQ